MQLLGSILTMVKSAKTIHATHFAYKNKLEPMICSKINAWNAHLL